MAIFIGGNTTELEYNFSMKVLGSMTECPMKCYWTRSKELLSPTDNRWKEFNQENYDKIKKQDNTSAMMDATLVEERPQFLIELDLNGLCDSYYGGSNSVLKGNMKNIWVGCYGINVDGWQMYVRENNSNIWTKWAEGKEDYLFNNSDSTYYTTNNKVYILLVSLNSASATIQSKINLDYIDIKLKLNRIPDRVDPINIELSNEWCLLFKGVSYSWENTTVDKYLFWLVGEPSEDIAFRYVSGNIGRFSVQYGPQIIIPSPNGPTLRSKQWENNSYLLQYKDNVYTCYHLDSQGIRKITFTDTRGFKKGIYKLYCLRQKNGDYQADAFVENVQVLPVAYTDSEAEVILRGRNDIDPSNAYYNKLVEIHKNPNLCPDFKDSHWLKPPNSVANDDGSTLTLNTTATYQGGSIMLPVLPNNRYKVTCTFGGQGHLGLAEKYNNTKIKEYRVLDSTGNYTGEFITNGNTNYIVLSCTNSTIGTFTFSNLELRRLD
ncbi:TPA: hypothetical protein LA742_000709 [Clostridium botulinum]|nr:hypothetical protein [Clostridium botulinum]